VIARVWQLGLLSATAPCLALIALVSGSAQVGNSQVSAQGALDWTSVDLGLPGLTVQDAALLRHTEEEDAGTTVTQKMQRMLPLTTQPSLLEGGMLRDYQLQGVNWLACLYVNGASGILADEMGLGKTVQTVAMLALLMECGAAGPFLILAPKSTLCNWASELAKWLPNARVMYLQGTKEERQVMLTDMLHPGNFDIVLTSYEMMLRESTELIKRHWRYVAIDEAHRIKNEESLLVCALLLCTTLLCTCLLVSLLPPRFTSLHHPLEHLEHRIWSTARFGRCKSIGGYGDKPVMLLSDLLVISCGILSSDEKCHRTRRVVGRE